MEQWRIIESFPQYEASTLGNIRNKTTLKDIAKTEKEGYLYVTLRQDGKYYNRSVHRLVAEAFIDNPDNKPIVVHIDGNNLNNNIANLQWDTYKIRNPDNFVRKEKPNIELKEDETWKRVKGYKKYKISTYGNIKNKHNKILSLTQDKRGYLKTGLRNGTDLKTCYIHTLMAKTFLGKKDDGTVVNHKDGNKSNNKLDNLEVITQSENVQHAYDNGLCSKQQKVIQVDYLGKIVREFPSIKKAAKLNNIDSHTLSYAVHNTTVTGGYKWFKDKASYEQELKNGDILKNFFKVIQCDDDLHIINTFDSYPEAEAATTITRSNISRSANEGLKAGDYRWFHNMHDYREAVKANQEREYILKVDYKGQIVARYKTIKETSDATGINECTLIWALDKGNVSNGYRWFRTREAYQEEVDSGDIFLNFFKVFQCNNEGDIINIFNSYPEAEEVTKVKKANISKSCNKACTAGGFRWFNCYQSYKDYFKK
jgi:hypothetical protein